MNYCDVTSTEATGDIPEATHQPFTQDIIPPFTQEDYTSSDASQSCVDDGVIDLCSSSDDEDDLPPPSPFQKKTLPPVNIHPKETPNREEPIPKVPSIISPPQCSPDPSKKSVPWSMTISLKAYKQYAAYHNFSGRKPEINYAAIDPRYTKKPVNILFPPGYTLPNITGLAVSTKL